jgi:Ca2+-binding RTX toxin-like protein
MATLTGDSTDNLLTGTSGDDSIDAGSGNDTLIGGEGDDTLDGGLGDDTFVFSGEWGADEIVKHGSDGGDDTLDFSGANAGVNVNLLQGGGGHATDGANTVDWGSSVKLENVIGSNYNDTLDGSHGNGSPNILDGGSGNDIISASTGDDILIGGTGNDDMAGGNGNDTYVFNHITTGGEVHDYQTDNHAHWLLRFAAYGKLHGKNYSGGLDILPPGQELIHWVTDSTKVEGGYFKEKGIETAFKAYYKDFHVDGTKALGGYFGNKITEKLWQQVKVTDFDTHHTIIANEIDVIDDAGGNSDVVDFSSISGLSSSTALSTWKFAHDASNAGDLDILMGDGGHLLTIKSYFTADGTGHFHGETETFHFDSGADLGFTDISASALNHTYNTVTHEFI